MIRDNRLNIERLVLLTLILLPLAFFNTEAGSAHESRPLFIEIIETGPEVFFVRWKIPETVPSFNLPSPVMPDNCLRKEGEFAGNVTGSYVRERSYECRGGLSGRTLGVQYPLLNPSVSTLLRVQTISGEKYNKLLSPDEKVWEVPMGENPYSIAKQYTLLGIRHILEGYDHLLFLVCLILIAGTGRRILITITGFTLAHSVTLVLSALNLVRVPIAPVEAAIALSIVFLATEIARETRDTLTYKYPLAVSVSFGLLHGFGFAAVLKETGLPQTELATSLLFFNIGVEIGQILFICAVIALYKIYKSIAVGGIIDLRKLERPSAYAVGSLAAFWMIERIYSF